MSDKSKVGRIFLHGEHASHTSATLPQNQAFIVTLPLGYRYVSAGQLQVEDAPWGATEQKGWLPSPYVHGTQQTVVFFYRAVASESPGDEVHVARVHYHVICERSDESDLEITTNTGTDGTYITDVPGG